MSKKVKSHTLLEAMCRIDGALVEVITLMDISDTTWAEEVEERGWQGITLVSGDI